MVMQIVRLQQFVDCNTLITHLSLINLLIFPSSKLGLQQRNIFIFTSIYLQVKVMGIWGILASHKALPKPREELSELCDGV